MPLSRLPPEITAHITNYLTHPQITSVSLVCRAWRLALIPVLYQSVQLDSDDRAVQLTNTVSPVGVVGLSPYILQSIRFLTIRQCFGTDANKTNVRLATLSPCMTYLTELRGLYCYIIGELILDNTEFIKLAQNKCPKLEIVDFYIQGRAIGAERGQSLFASLLGFRNLVEYSLIISFLDVTFEALEPLESLAANCPRLESVKLGFSFATSTERGFFTPDMVARSFGKSTMPFLHTLHIRGNIKQHLEIFSDSPVTGSHSFRDFLSRHPHIKDFKIGGFITNTDPDIDPENLARAFPSLKYFSAPKLLCAKLWRSTLANQIECLSIQAGVWDLEEVSELPPMPMLRQLRIEESDPLETLKLMGMIMPLARGIEHLRTETHDIPYSLHTRFLALLAHTPNLQTIGMYDYSWHHRSGKPVKRIGQKYPKVKVIEQISWPGWYNDS